MGLLFTQSQNTILKVTEEERDFIENDTDLIDRSKSFKIEVDFMENGDEHIIVFHNGEPYREELYDEFSGDKMYTPTHKEEDKDTFKKRVQKLLKETEPDYAVYDYDTSPNLEKMSKNLDEVKHRFFCC